MHLLGSAEICELFFIAMHSIAMLNLPSGHSKCRPFIGSNRRVSSVRSSCDVTTSVWQLLVESGEASSIKIRQQLANDRDRRKDMNFSVFRSSINVG